MNFIAISLGVYNECSPTFIGSCKAVRRSLQSAFSETSREFLAFLQFISVDLRIVLYYFLNINFPHEYPAS